MRMLLLAGCVLVWVASVLWAARTGPERSRRAARWVALVATGTLVSALGTGLATGSAEAGTGHTGHATAAPATGAMTGDSYWQQVGGSPFHPTGTVRTYYLGADEVAWDYAPTGRNPVTGKDFDDVADVFVKRGPGRIGSTYLKCLYRQYTDATFTTQTPVPAADAYLG